MNTVNWRVKIMQAPKILKYCKKCGVKTEYVSSGLFRVNANSKSLDIWLIYRCHDCKTTWNSTVFERVNPKALNEKTLKGFHDNNSDLALSYGLNEELLRRNGAEVLPPDYEVTGEDVDLTEDTRIIISADYPLNIRVTKILRKKLGVSGREFKMLLESGRLESESAGNISKLKLLDKCTILVHKMV